MPLEEYRRKRDPRRTPEPVPSEERLPSSGQASGGSPDSSTDDAGTKQRAFVIQEHHARSLHWDLRLERDGVLASWAVPKGLPPDPKAIRLAVRTEDHPIEYLDFSGEIPAGEYGAGQMTIWDRGHYDTVKWTESEVQFVLHGERVHGRYVLIYRGRHDNRKATEWLLRRADPPVDPDWRPIPDGLRPMESIPGELPVDDEAGDHDDHPWCYEVRFGGKRVLVRVEGGRVALFAPDGAEVAEHFELSGLGAALGATPALLDGELAGSPPGLWISDLLHLDGRDCLELPYRDRRKLLEELPLTGPHWRLVPSYSGDGAAVLAAAREQGLPAVVAKRADSPYRPGERGPDWVEIPAAPDQQSAQKPDQKPDNKRDGKAVREGATRTANEPATKPAGTVLPSSGSSSVASVEVAGRRVRLANPEKVLYPAIGFRKRDIVDYYLAVAEVMLPHLVDRPVTLRRWPNGVTAPSFFEKNVSGHAPSWVRTVRLPTPGSSAGSEAIDYPLIEDAAGLAWVANLAALELHVPQWRVGPRGGQHEPDLLVFDLDPGEGVTIVECAAVARWLADVLAEDGLPAFPRTSGSKGMQLYTPVRVSQSRRTSEYARAVAERLATADPKRITAVMAKQRRRGKVFIDWSQNNPAKTTVASYSLRGGELPTVATPITWEEVAACRRPEDLRFTAMDLPDRLARLGDLLSPLLGAKYRLPPKR